MATDAGWVKSSQEQNALTLTLGGAWTLEHLKRLSGELNALLARPDARAAKVTLDLAQVTTLDSSGAWAVFGAAKRLTDRKVPVDIVNAQQAQAALIERVRQATAKPIAKPKKLHPLIALLTAMGRATIEFLKKGHELLGFLGLIVVAFARSWRHPSRIQFKAVIAHLQATGLNALPIVGLLSFLIGIVLAYQGAVQLKKFGAEIFTVDLLGVAILRELGVLITSIVIAGRSGSAFTAQIGTMKVNQEVDAMQTIGLDPIDVLVLPRIVALMIALPLLGFYADIIGLLGGAFMCLVTLGISPTAFLTQLSSAVDVTTFWVGVSKAPVFAFLIAMVGCFEGLQVSGSAESVGRRTTMSVVEGIFLVLVMDGIFSIIFSYLGI